MMESNEEYYESIEEQRIDRRLSGHPLLEYFTPKFFWFLTKSKTKILFKPKELEESTLDSTVLTCHSFEFEKTKYKIDSYAQRVISCAASLPTPLILIKEHPLEYSRLSAKKQRDIRFLREITRIDVGIYSESQKGDYTSVMHFFHGKLSLNLYLPSDEFEEYWQLKSCGQLLFNIEVKLPIYDEPNESTLEYRGYIDVLGIIDEKNILEKSRADDERAPSTILNIDFSSVNIDYKIFHKSGYLSQKLRDMQINKHDNRGYYRGAF